MRQVKRIGENEVYTTVKIKEKRIEKEVMEWLSKKQGKGIDVIKEPFLSLQQKNGCSIKNSENKKIQQIHDSLLPTLTEDEVNVLHIKKMKKKIEEGACLFFDEKEELLIIRELLSSFAVEFERNTWDYHCCDANAIIKKIDTFLKEDASFNRTVTITEQLVLDNQYDFLFFSKDELRCIRAFLSKVACQYEDDQEEFINDDTDNIIYKINQFIS